MALFNRKPKNQAFFRVLSFDSNYEKTLRSLFPDSENPTKVNVYISSKETIPADKVEIVFLIIEECLHSESSFAGIETQISNNLVGCEPVIQKLDNGIIISL